MKNKIFVTCFSSLILVACQSTAMQQYRASPDRPKPTQTDIAKVSQTLVDAKCRGSKGQREYEACLTIVVAQLPQIDASKRDHFGERYDPKTWYACMQEGGDHGYFKNDNCDVYQLRRLDDNIAKPKIDMPEIKWPRSTELPAPSRGMSNRDYFRFLCNSEGGETIYKTVENVQGVLQMRPIFEPTDLEYSDRYVLEDPYSITRENKSEPWESYVQPVFGQYDFLDVWSSTVRNYTSVHRINKDIDFSQVQSHFVQFYRDPTAHPDRKKHSYVGGQSFQGGQSIEVPDLVNAKLLDKTTAIYGYTWRGVGGAKLRELGIAAGDQAIVDLRTGDVLAMRRGFLFSDLTARGLSVWWLDASNCSKEAASRTSEFVKKVLKPIHPFGSIN